MSAREVDLSRLAELDPAGPPDPGAGHGVVAQAVLERVVASPREAGDGLGELAPPRARAARRAGPGRPARLGLVGAGAVVLGVALAVLPGPGDAGAGAAWTAVPGALDEAETAAAAEECRDLARGFDDAPSDASAAAGVPLVAEHRGDVGLVAVGGDDWVAACLLDDTGYVASYAPAAAVALADEPAADEVLWWSGFMSRQEDGTALHAAVGRAGADVAAVTLHPVGAAVGAEVVHATLDDGWFVAFWPVPGRHAGRDPLDTPLTVTLRTGEVRDVVVQWGAAVAGTDEP